MAADEYILDWYTKECPDLKESVWSNPYNAWKKAKKKKKQNEK